MSKTKNSWFIKKKIYTKFISLIPLNIKAYIGFLGFDQNGSVYSPDWRKISKRFVYIIFKYIFIYILSNEKVTL